MDMAETLLLALALMLIIEGMFPVRVPDRMARYVPPHRGAADAPYPHRRPGRDGARADPAPDRDLRHGRQAVAARSPILSLSFVPDRSSPLSAARPAPALTSRRKRIDVHLVTSREYRRRLAVGSPQDRRAAPPPARPFPFVRLRTRDAADARVSRIAADERRQRPRICAPSSSSINCPGARSACARTSRRRCRASTRIC